MRTKITVALLLINAVLAFFVFRIHSDNSQAQRDAALKEPRVLGPEVSNLREFQLTNAEGQVSISLKRPDANSPWQITHPVDWPANDFAVDRILTELRFLGYETSFAVADIGKTGQSLSDYGLNPPRENIILTRPSPSQENAEPLKTVIGIGDPTRNGNRLYLLSPDKTRVFIINRSFLESLADNLKNLRSENIFTIPVYEARSLSIQTTASDGPRIRIRRDNANWAFETPFAARASKTATELTISSLNALRAQRFLDGNNATNTLTQLNNPAYRIIIEGNNRRETLLIGETYKGPDAAPEQFYAKMEDRNQVFVTQIPEKLISSLRLAQQRLRDPRILQIDDSRLVTITLGTPDQPDLILQKLEGNGDATQWQITRPLNGSPQKNHSAETALVNHLIEHLTLLNATRFVSDAPSAAELEQLGFNRPELEVTLTTLIPAPNTNTPDTPTRLTLQLAQASSTDNNVYARILGQTSIYELPLAALQRISTNPNDYRQRILYNLSEGTRITALKILPNDQGDDAQPILSLERGSAQTWAEVLEQQKPEHKDAIESLIKNLRTLKAQRIIEDQVSDSIEIDGEQQAWKYRLELTLALAGANEPRTYRLYFSQRIGGSVQYAAAPDQNLTFILDQPLIDALWTILRPPNPSLQEEESPPAAIPDLPTEPITIFSPENS